MRTLPPRIQERNDAADAVKRWLLNKPQAIKAIRKYAEAVIDKDHQPYLPHGDPSGAMGTRTGAYALPNGMIFMTYLNHGWIERGLLWKNIEDFKIADRYMPANIYWEY